MECPENIPTSSLKANILLAEYDSIRNKVIHRYPFNRTPEELSSAQYAFFFQEWMVLYKVPIKRSTGHQSQAQQNHWAYRHRPGVKIQGSHTVNEYHHATYPEGCLCISLLARGKRHQLAGLAEKQGPRLKETLSQKINMENA